mgnify:CR=1 FL=1
MFPELFNFYARNGNLIYAKFFSKRTLCFSQNSFSYFFDLILCKFYSRIIYSFIRVTAFFKSIFHVFRLCPNPKMFWIKAIRVITSVQHIKLGVYIKIIKHIRTYSVCTIKSTTNPYGSITQTSCSSSPNPTICFRDYFSFGEKFFFEFRKIFDVSSSSHNNNIS